MTPERWRAGTVSIACEQEDFIEPHLIVGDRFAQAVAYAATLHADQTRKGVTVPYISHLLGAASFLIEQPGATEDMAIAALLHDAIEDQPDSTSYAEITRRFGADVATIVRDCTDAETHPKPPWRHRKTTYIAHLEHVAEPSLMVSLADKIHNVRAMLTDAQLGRADWHRFTAPPPAQRWYYTSLAQVFVRRLGTDLAHAFDATVAAVFGDVGADLDLQAHRDRPDWVATDTVTAWVADLDAAAAICDEPLDAVAEGTWRGTDGGWWVEQTDDPQRPYLVFVRPSSD